MSDPASFIQCCRSVRVGIKTLAAEVKELKHHSELTGELQAPSTDVAEAQANVMLSYRHLEDSAMRLGKAIQAYDGGVSVYDK